ncbi:MULTISPECIES: flippase [Leclercia]|uniref:flippase n=1 Tax=Leclercia TaxID=83654 RepID=UPI000CD0BB27|nr:MULTISPECIES: flippase [Leclercia]AUU86116.1 flippase [Leclercia sp. LSNIH1]POV36410.1 flippase [Leclercia sp. LSNIH5]POW68646.1 flippase [Leclercia sp. LSNIH2]
MGLIKNSVWNLAGYVVPTAIAIPAMGYLARVLGVELFGVYTLAIAIVGYAGIFDIGLTRAIVREIAVYRGDIDERKKIISTATIFLFLFSVFGAILISLFTPNIISLLNITASNHTDVQNSIRVLVWTIPAFLLNQLWMSILEGDERFAILNIQRSFGSSIIAGLPALFVLVSPSLFSAILGLAVGRLLSLIIAFVIVRNEIINAGFIFYRETFRRMIFFGGWITVSNIISPVMVYFDRFVISGSLGADKVGYYTAPSEIVSRLGLLPGALSRAVFPKLSAAKTYDELKKNIRFAYLIMGLGCLPLVLILIFLAKLIMQLWLGDEYALHSQAIFQILLVGFFFNSIAQIPFTVIQSLGKAKYTAFLHCIEVIPYLALLYFCVNAYGVLGAAYAWTIRVFVDCILLIIVSRECINKHRGKI